MNQKVPKSSDEKTMNCRLGGGQKMFPPFWNRNHSSNQFFLDLLCIFFNNTYKSFSISFIRYISKFALLIFHICLNFHVFQVLKISFNLSATLNARSALCGDNETDKCINNCLSSFLSDIPPGGHPRRQRWHFINVGFTSRTLHIICCVLFFLICFSASSCMKWRSSQQVFNCIFQMRFMDFFEFLVGANKEWDPRDWY